MFIYIYISKGKCINGFTLRAHGKPFGKISIVFLGGVWKLHLSQPCNDISTWQEKGKGKKKMGKEKKEHDYKLLIP